MFVGLGSAIGQGKNALTAVALFSTIVIIITSPKRLLGGMFGATLGRFKYLCPIWQLYD
jgi:hypothetical protein